MVAGIITVLNVPMIVALAAKIVLRGRTRNLFLKNLMK